MRDLDEVILGLELHPSRFGEGQTVYWKRQDGDHMLCMIADMKKSSLGVDLYGLRPYRFNSDGTIKGLGQTAVYVYANEILEYNVDPEDT